MTLSEALSWGTEQIHNAQVSDTPLLDASLILTRLLGLSRVDLYTKGSRPLSEEELRSFEQKIIQRRHHHPIAYITGEKEFYGRLFHVDESVLIPRRDTETAVEVALSLSGKSSQTMSILDLCCGSGCIGITIALELPGAQVTLSDLSEDALRIAQRNCSSHRKLLEVVQGNLFEAFPETRFDQIISNPPYVAPSWYQECSDEVKKEPRLAIVDETENGLSIIEKIITQSPAHLHKEGSLVIECDYRQVKAVKGIFAGSGFGDIAITPDMGGRDRVVSGRLMCTRI